MHVQKVALTLVASSSGCTEMPLRAAVICDGGSRGGGLHRPAETGLQGGVLGIRIWFFLKFPKGEPGLKTTDKDTYESLPLVYLAILEASVNG